MFVKYRIISYFIFDCIDQLFYSQSRFFLYFFKKPINNLLQEKNTLYMYIIRVPSWKVMKIDENVEKRTV